MATSKRVVSVSVKRSKRDRAQKIPTVPLAEIVNSDYAKQMRAARNILVEQRDHWKERAEKAESRPPVTDGIGVIRLDPALLTMLRENVAVIRKVYPDVWDVPSWDVPWISWEVDWGDSAASAQFTYAVGFIAGAAAMMDLTPCMLIDNLRL